MYVTRKLAFAVVLFASALVAIGANAHAAELVMFERPGCPWCKRWHTEIGPAYPLTTEGKAAPLRRHHIRDQTLAGITLSRPVTVSRHLFWQKAGARSDGSLATLARISSMECSMGFSRTHRNSADHMPRCERCRSPSPRSRPQCGVSSRAVTNAVRSPFAWCRTSFFVLTAS